MQQPSGLAAAVAVCLLSFILTCKGDLQQDANVLLAFRSDIRNWRTVASASQLQGWSSENASDICMWSFVTCDGARESVTGLSMDGNRLQVTPEGTLSPVLANLTGLTTLSIQNTLLGGSLYDEWAEPGSFPELTLLQLLNNSLDGPLPSSWGTRAAFPELLEMGLDRNMLSSSLPASWGDEGVWENLNKFSAAHNHLSGSLPPEWGASGRGGLAGINNITLANNLLTGTLPPWNGSGLYSMIYLDLSSNQLTGTLVSQWATSTGLPRLTSLTLSDNQLAGPLPGAWGLLNRFTALQYLDLSENMLTSSLPDEWSTPNSLSSLYSITLDRNPLTGTLPPEWANASVLNSLGVLSMVNTSLGGTLPTEWGGRSGQAGIAGLVELDLGYTQLEGELPAAWGNGSFPALLTLSIPNTRISGTLPPNWGSNDAFPMLTALDLSGNDISGTLPAEWGSETTYDYLRVLLLGGNKLTGDLPPGWGQPSAWPVLRQLDLSDNNLTSAIPQEWGIFGNDISIWLSPGNEGICGASQLSSPICSLPLDCAPTASDPNCPCNDFIPPPCPGDVPTAVPPALSKVSGLKATLELVGIASTSWTQAQSDALITALADQMGDPDILPQAISISQVDATPQMQHRQLLSQQAPEANVGAESLFHGSVARSFRGAVRKLLQPPSTTVVILVNVEGQDQYEQAQSELRNVTASSRNSPLMQQLVATGLFTGLQSLSLTAVEPSFVPVNAPNSASPSGSDGASTGAIVGGVIGAVIGIVLVTLLVTFFLYRVHKKRRLRKEAMGKPKSSTTSAAGLFDSARHSETSNLSQKRSGSDAGLELAFSDWLVSPEEIEICHRADGSLWHLGSGGFGCVYKAMRGGVTTVAVKVMGETTAGQRQAAKLLEQQDMFQREIHLLKSCRDRNIVQFLGACVEPGRLMLVTEYLEGGDLFTALERDSATPPKFSWWKHPVKAGEERKVQGLARRVALDTARGLAFLHHRKIVHRDIKTSNILLARDGTAKLADVGLAKILRNDFLSTLQGQLGTFAWAAPEILLGRECSEKVDIYSFGVVLWELSTGEQPDGRFLRPVREADDCPVAVVELLSSCLAEDPSARPSAYDIVQILSSPDLK